jgi:3-dehydroquinate synthase
MKSPLLLKPKTPIHVGSGLIGSDTFIKFCKDLEAPLAIITDSHLNPLYGQPLLNLLKKEGIEATLHVFPRGEKYKNRQTKQKLEDELFLQGHNRESCLVALGGGVTLDLTGYIASTFCRGIPYFSIPTSFLAMTDASIGGKTGINLPFGKNLIGTIYHPLAVFIDLTFLETLSDKEMREGLIEVIKHGLIFDRSLIETFEQHVEKWEMRAIPFLKSLIHQSCKIKTCIVEKDPREEGLRRILNFGHTIAHAIETVETYTISHGEAVAIGLIVESFISVEMGKLDERAFDYLYALLKELGYPLKISAHISTKMILEAMLYDKKVRKRAPRFVVLDGIGKTLSFKQAYCTEIDEDLLFQALSWMIAEFHQDTQEVCESVPD